VSSRKLFFVCSHDIGFVKLLKKAHEEDPSAELYCVFTRDRLPTDGERALLAGTLHSTSRTLSAFGGLGGLIRLAGQIRQQHPDELVFQFESMKLRLFGIACKPRLCRAWLGNGQRLELPLSLCATLVDLYVHRAKGYGMTLLAGFHAYVLGFWNERPERR